jgi:hypothetical protein
VLLAALTRPVVVAVELEDPERAQRALDGIVAPARIGAGRLSREIDCRVARDDRGRLVLTLDLFGAVTTRHTVRVEDGWLLVSNDQTQPTPLVAGSEPASGAAASVSLRPGALRLGLPAAWHAAVEADAGASWAALHWLAPWTSAGASVGEAIEASRATFGSAPVLAADAAPPGPNHALEHRRFGSPARPRIPARDPGRDFGLFEGVAEATVEAAFEGEGLRTRVRWRSAPGER